MATLSGAIGQTVRLCGFAQLVPAAVALPAPAPATLLLRDHTGLVQLIEGAGGGAEPLREQLADLLDASAIEVVGQVRNDPREDQVIVIVDEMRVVGPARGEVPLAPGSPLEERLDWRFLDLRRPAARLIFEVQTTAERAMRQVWEEEAFIEIHSPKLRATANRSGRELFTLDYFGRPAYLAQSPQFHKQMAMAAGFDRVFEIGPVFRANPLATDRHDTEFTSVDIEVAWIDSHEDLMAQEERWLARVIEAVAARHGPEIERWCGTQVRVPAVPFPRVPMGEAYHILAGLGWDGDTSRGDIDRPGEQLLAAHVASAFDHDFVFVTDYGAAARPFYHMRSEHGSASTRGFDLLWKGLEVTTGAQREHRYDQLVEQARSRGISLPAIQFYLDYFRFGCPPHGGFGLGLTRMLMALLGQADVREVTYLHRGPRRLAP